MYWLREREREREKWREREARDAGYTVKNSRRDAISDPRCFPSFLFLFFFFFLDSFFSFHHFPDFSACPFHACVRKKSQRLVAEVIFIAGEPFIYRTCALFFQHRKLQLFETLNSRPPRLFHPSCTFPFSFFFFFFGFIATSGEFISPNEYSLSFAPPLPPTSKNISRGIVPARVEIQKNWFDKSRTKGFAWFVDFTISRQEIIFKHFRTFAAIFRWTRSSSALGECNF